MENVLIVNLGKSYGGAENYVEQLSNIEGCLINYFFLVRKGSVFERKILTTKASGRVLSIDFFGKTLLHDLLQTNIFIKKHCINVIHTNGINSEFFISILKLFKIDKKVKYITTVHGIAEYDRIEYNKFKRVFFAKLQVSAIKSFDSIIAVSNSIREDLLKKGIEDRKVIVIYHGIVREKELVQYCIHKPFRICSVGRLEKVKNICLLIEALAKVDINKAGDYRCDIYGTGKEHNNLKILIDKLGLNDKVKLQGYAEDVRSVYLSHDLLVQPSMYESFGLSVLEAMSVGIPVLCSNVGGMLELVDDRVNGMFFDANSVNDLRDKITECMQGKIDMKIIRKRAFEIVDKNYSIEEMRKKTIALYR